MRVSFFLQICANMRKLFRRGGGAKSEEEILSWTLHLSRPVLGGMKEKSSGQRCFGTQLAQCHRSRYWCTAETKVLFQGFKQKFYVPVDVRRITASLLSGVTSLSGMIAALRLLFWIALEGARPRDGFSKKVLKCVCARSLRICFARSVSSLKQAMLDDQLHKHAPNVSEAALVTLCYCLHENGRGENRSCSVKQIGFHMFDDVQPRRLIFGKETAGNQKIA